MDIAESIRCLLEDDEIVMRRFYSRFLKRDHRLSKLFERVDLDEQATMLTTALSTVELNYTGNWSAVRKYLIVLGQKHAEIPMRELFPTFSDCLVETLAEYHGQQNWNEQLELQWREAIEQAFEVMLEGYIRENKD